MTKKDKLKKLFVKAKTVTATLFARKVWEDHAEKAFDFLVDKAEAVLDFVAAML